jgi:hypothetical protein
MRCSDEYVTATPARLSGPKIFALCILQLYIPLAITIMTLALKVSTIAFQIQLRFD